MVKASGQIEKELALLQQQTEAMANALEPLYDSYLKALSDAGARQLILAAYHLCTQAYPDKFLTLSWEQRNQVQQDLQALSGQIYDQMSTQREQAQKMSRRPQQHSGLEFLQRLLEARAAGTAVVATEEDRHDLVEKLSALSRSDLQPLDEDLSDQADVDLYEDSGDGDEDDGFNHADFDSDQLADDGLGHPSDLGDDELGFEMEVPAADQRLSLSEEEDLLSALEGLARRSVKKNASEDSEEAQLLAPIHLVRQQVLLEKAIREIFKAVSEEANELLQKANVMPSFPKALMAAATDSQGMGEPVNAVPNVVTLSVRVMHGEAMMESEEDDEDSRPARRRRSRRVDRHSSEAETGRSPGAPKSEMREEGMSSRQRIPQDAVEVDALPELAAISLRLSEVEFTDPTVSAWRSRLRQKLSELKQLGMRYKKTQRALETAQAEDAWRSSWTVHSQDETG